MLRKISIAIVGTMLLSGAAAAAQPTPTFPLSVNETGPVHPAATVERGFGAIGATTANAATEYVQVYDRKYNTVRLVKKQSPGSFVGTSAPQRRTVPRQHP